MPRWRCIQMLIEPIKIDCFSLHFHVWCWRRSRECFNEIYASLSRTGSTETLEVLLCFRRNHEKNNRTLSTFNNFVLYKTTFFSHIHFNRSKELPIMAMLMNTFSYFVFTALISLWISSAHGGKNLTDRSLIFISIFLCSEYAAICIKLHRWFVHTENYEQWW